MYTVIDRQMTLKKIAFPYSRGGGVEGRPKTHKSVKNFEINFSSNKNLPYIYYVYEKWLIL
jgi:hypothetical protein